VDTDMMIRVKAFDWLADQVGVHSDVLPRKLLEQGFDFQGQRVPMISPQGIFKPRIMDLPLSITTSPASPYGDGFSEEGFLYYRYRGTDPNHGDNVGLRQVFEKNRPLVYLHGIVPGRYLAIWPVYIVGDDPAALTFKVCVDDVASIAAQPESPLSAKEATEARRAYITTTMRQRLHQRTFRERVLEAYRSQCAFCRLRHRELLDAAHIVPDHIPAGEPTISNGIALCKLHHAAFDSFIIGVSPDYIIRVRGDILEEEDGPVLLHGLQGLHNKKLILPTSQTNWPSPDYLDWRYDRFLKAA
jgi:putative restriction endonuclease